MTMNGWIECGGSQRGTTEWDGVAIDGRVGRGCVADWGTGLLAVAELGRGVLLMAEQGY
jgi:hypothetical protein